MNTECKEKQRGKVRQYKKEEREKRRKRKGMEGKVLRNRKEKTYCEQRINREKKKGRGVKL